MVCQLSRSRWIPFFGILTIIANSPVKILDSQEQLCRDSRSCDELLRGETVMPGSLAPLKRIDRGSNFLFVWRSNPYSLDTATSRFIHKRWTSTRCYTVENPGEMFLPPLKLPVVVMSNFLHKVVKRPSFVIRYTVTKLQFFRQFLLPCPAR